MRRKAKNHRSENRERQREGENSAVHSERQANWKVRGRRKHGEEIRGPQTDQNSRCASHSGKQQAFDEQLANQPRAVRTQRRTNRYFLFAHRGSREKQIRYVRAGNEQNKNYDDHQKR